MNAKLKLGFLTTGLAFALTGAAAAQTATAIPPSITTPDKVETRIGTLDFKDGAPSAATAEKVLDSLDYVRGVDAFMNSFSGASAYAIRKGFHGIGQHAADLRVCGHRFRANRVDVELIKLAKAARPRLFITPDRPDLIAAERHR